MSVPRVCAGGHVSDVLRFPAITTNLGGKEALPISSLLPANLWRIALTGCFAAFERCVWVPGKEPADYESPLLRHRPEGTL